MKKIRIGTDVRVRTTLNELDSFDALSVKQLVCYFVRKCDLKYIDLQHPGYPQFYFPTEYNTMLSGAPRYNWMPYNGYVFNSGMFGVIDDYRLFPSYNGFGVNSRQFKLTAKEYLAPSKVLADTNKIECYFPAIDQKFLGEYRLIIVVTCYQQGWGSNNLRTTTVDKGVVFALTDCENGESGDIVIVDTDAATAVNMQVNSPITMTPNNTLAVGSSDIYGKQYKVQLVMSDGSTKTWSNDYAQDIKLTSDSASDISVDKETGVISVGNVTQDKSIMLHFSGEQVSSDIQLNIKKDRNVTIIDGNSVHNGSAVYYSQFQYKYYLNDLASIKVMMGNVDITNTVYNSISKTVVIEHVTDDVIITLTKTSA